MVISGNHPVLGEVRPGHAFLFGLSVFHFFPHLFSHSHNTVLKRSSVGSTFGCHSYWGLIAIMDIVRARMVSNQMVTKKISVKESCEKAKPGSPVSPRARARTAKAGSSMLREKPIHRRHLESDRFEVSSFLLEMLHNLRRWFYHIGQSCGLVCFEPLSFGLWVDWSPFWHPQQWNACGGSEDQIAQRKRRIY